MLFFSNIAMADSFTLAEKKAAAAVATTVRLVWQCRSAVIKFPTNNCQKGKSIGNFGARQEVAGVNTLNQAADCKAQGEAGKRITLCYP